MNTVELMRRKEYWAHVFICLMQFHSHTKSEAKKLVLEYLKRFPIKSQAPEIELIYHFEPFRLACKITGNKLNVKDFAEDYSKILQIEFPWRLQGIPGTYILEIFRTIDDGKNVRKLKTQKNSSHSDAKPADSGKRVVMRSAAKGTTKKTSSEKPANNTVGGSGKIDSRKASGGKLKKAR